MIRTHLPYDGRNHPRTEEGQDNQRTGQWQYDKPVEQSTRCPLAFSAKAENHTAIPVQPGICIVPIIVLLPLPVEVCEEQVANSQKKTNDEHQVGVGVERMGGIVDHVAWNGVERSLDVCSPKCKHMCRHNIESEAAYRSISRARPRCEGTTMSTIVEYVSIYISHRV